MSFSRSSAALAVIALSPIALAQQPGTNTPEEHPSLPLQICTKTINVPGKALQAEAEVATCLTENTSIVIDADWRAVNVVGTTDRCHTDGKWNSAICATPEECARICGLEGVDYIGNHSVITTGNALSMKLVTPGHADTRVYMLDASGTRYKQFMLLNQEFTFDVDMSSLPCGSNGALYFSKMDADGGTSRYPTNTAGAAYGTGYCDAQCTKNGNFIDGMANINKTYGSCCSEMDIWEANSMATAYTSHACSIDGQQRCYADEDCGATAETRNTGWCDKPGCDFNPFRMGNREFYGRGKDFDIDTTRPFTVVTQFLTHDNTETGELVEIRRLYKQDDRIVYNPGSTWPELNGTDSITTAMCDASKTLFNQSLSAMGGLTQLGKDMLSGMTLAMSIWVDYGSNMTWLDSYTGKDPNAPGAMRGNCPRPGGDPNSVFAASPDATANFMNIRVGDFGSTY